MRKKSISAALTVLCCLFLLAGCEKGAKVVFTTGFARDEVFKIGDISCTLGEMNVYLTTMQNRYEEVYGSEVWKIEKGDMKLADNVKDSVLARLAQVKSMYLLAKSKNVTLDETETGKVKRAAAEYLAGISQADMEALGITEATVTDLYTEYAMADKVYDTLIAGVNPEISDDEARTIVVQNIFLSTDKIGSGNESSGFAAEGKKEVYNKMYDIRQEALGGADFYELAAKYSENSNISLAISKGTKDKAIEDAAFQLSTGEISDIVETDEGYYIFKCISTFDREQTEVSKLEIVETRRMEVFGEEYNAFVSSLTRRLNNELWDSITIGEETGKKVPDFFDIYDKYFGE